jgi:hypothetical protein
MMSATLPSRPSTSLVVRCCPNVETVDIDRNAQGAYAACGKGCRLRGVGWVLNKRGIAGIEQDVADESERLQCVTDDDDLIRLARQATSLTQVKRDLLAQQSQASGVTVPKVHEWVRPPQAASQLGEGIERKLIQGRRPGTEVELLDAAPRKIHVEDALPPVRKRP